MPRVFEGIKKAEFMIADLTHERPCVYLEVGYALAFGHTPILIAREGTHIHFDLEGYTVNYFSNMEELNERLGDQLEKLILKRGEARSNSLDLRSMRDMLVGIGKLIPKELGAGDKIQEFAKKKIPDEIRDSVKKRPTSKKRPDDYFT
jgi:hypothetical protein